MEFFNTKVHWCPSDFCQDPHKELRGKNVLIVRASLQETARLCDVDEAEAKEQLARAREILFEERRNRPPPHLDTKMITAWNGENSPHNF